MGQKVNPISMRLQINKDWRSKWFALKRDYVGNLDRDLRVRRFVEGRFVNRAIIDHMDIEHAPNLITVTVYTAKAGVLIGRSGSGAQELKNQIENIMKMPVRLNIEEVRRPELAAKLVAENIARQMERRINFRRAIKSAAQSTMQAGAKGIRIQVAGRLNGAEMSRSEKEIQGSVPLHTLRADISYHQGVAQIPGAGTVGVKVWVNRGEVA